MFLHLSVILFTWGVGFPECITGHMTRWGVHPGGLPPGGYASRGDWVVRILLACILVINTSADELLMHFRNGLMTSFDKLSDFLNHFLDEK